MYPRQLMYRLLEFKHFILYLVDIRRLSLVLYLQSIVCILQ